MKKIAILGLVAVMVMASLMVIVPENVSANPTPNLIYHTAAGNDVYQVAVSGDGYTAAAASKDGNIYVVGRSGLKTSFAVASGYEATSVAVSRDGNYIIGGDSGGYLWLLDWEGNQLDSWNGLSESYIYAVDIDQSGNHVIDSDNVGISYFDTSAHNLNTKDWYSTSYPNYEVDMSDNGNRILLFSLTNDDMMVKDGAGNNLWSTKWTEPNSAEINWADMSEDGSTVAVVTDNNRLYLLDASNGAQEWYATLSASSTDVSVSGDGSYIVCAPNGVITLFSYSSNTPVDSWGTSKYSPVISYDGSHISASSANYEYLYDITGNEVWSYPITTGSYYRGQGRAISDYGSYIILADGATNYNIYYFTSIPETHISYDISYTSGSTLYLSDTTTLTLTADYIAPSLTSYWKVDSEAYHLYSGQFTLSSYSEGSHTLYYYSVDSYGNPETAKSLDFYLDKNSPSVTITSPIDNSWGNSTFTVRWTGSDEGSGIDHYEIRIDSGSWQNMGTASYHDFTGITDGQHTIDVRALDRFSHGGVDSVTLNVDGTDPTVSITSPTLNEILSSSDVFVSWTGSDSGSGIDHYEARIDGGSWINVGTATSYRFTGVPDGSHISTIKTVDKIGHYTTDSVSCMVDTTAPSVSVMSPNDEAITGSNTMTVSWTASDATSGIDHYEIRIDGGSWIDVGTATSHNFISLSDGSHTVNVKTIDNAGNENTDAVNYTVDTTAPSVSITSPRDGAIFATNSVTVSWAGSDATSGIDHYEIRMDDGSWIDVGTTTTHEFTGMSYGSHTLEVKIVDSAGNEDSDTISYSSFPWWIFIIVIVLLLIIFVAVKKRKKPEKEEIEKTTEKDEWPPLNSVPEKSENTHEEP